MELYHHGILGQKWGIRRYQNEDGSLTPAGKERYNKYRERELKYINVNYNKLEKQALKKNDKNLLNFVKEAKKIETDYVRKMSMDDIDKEKLIERQNRSKKFIAALLAGGGIGVAGISAAAMSPVGAVASIGLLEAAASYDFQTNQTIKFKKQKLRYNSKDLGKIQQMTQKGKDYCSVFDFNSPGYIAMQEAERLNHLAIQQSINDSMFRQQQHVNQQMHHMAVQNHMNMFGV